MISLIDAVVDEEPDSSHKQRFLKLKEDIFKSSHVWYTDWYDDSYQYNWPGKHWKEVKEYREGFVQLLSDFIGSRKMARRELETLLNVIAENCAGELTSDMETFSSEITEKFDDLD